MRTTLLMCLALVLAGCRARVGPPAGARVNVYTEWPTLVGTAPIEFDLSATEWTPVQSLLPDLNQGERKVWTNSVSRLGLTLVARDGKTIAQGYFVEPTILRLTFADGKTTFYNVSPHLKERLVAAAQARGLWKGAPDQAQPQQPAQAAVGKAPAATPTAPADPEAPSASTSRLCTSASRGELVAIKPARERGDVLVTTAADHDEDNAIQEKTVWTGDLNGDGLSDILVQEQDSCGNEGECVFNLYANCGNGTYRSVFPEEFDYFYELKVIEKKTGSWHRLRETQREDGGLSTKVAYRVLEFDEQSLKYKYR